MASISTDSTGKRRILFSDADGERRQIRLGYTSKSAANTIKGHVEEIVKATGLGVAIAPETVRYLMDAKDQLHKKFAQVGLAKPRNAVAEPGKVVECVKAFIDRYISIRTDVKPNTRKTWGQARDLLVEHFGDSRDIATVTALDAKAYKSWLASEGFAGASVSKYTYFARQFFQAAVDGRIIAENPFRGIKTGRRSNVARQYFVTPETISRVLDGATDPEFRLVLALSRFGGLRIPSELAGLKWQHIDRERGRILITSPKTERYDGGATREIPLFPELLRYIDEWWESEACPTGVEWVIPSNRFTQAAWRTRLMKLLRRLGIEPWPKIFHNMRASRQTELERSYPTYKVCRWLGNSERIANDHYLMMTDDDFLEASALNKKEAQKATQTATIMPRKGAQAEHGDEKIPEKCGISRGSDGGGGNRTRVL